MQMHGHVVPCSLILRLVLTPDEFFGRRVAAEFFFEHLRVERIELFDANKRRLLFETKFASFGLKVVVNLARAADDALYSGRINDGVIADGRRVFHAAAGI